MHSRKDLEVTGTDGGHGILRHLVAADVPVWVGGWVDGWVVELCTSYRD